MSTSIRLRCAFCIYGETLIQSGRWNWNADGPLVEAYTNPLYAILSIIPALLGLSAELFFKLVSLGIVASYVMVVRQFGLPKRQEFLLLAVRRHRAASPSDRRGEPEVPCGER